MSNDNEITTLVEKIKTDFGKLDILVNNAGIHIPGSIEDLSIQDWDRVTGVNIRGIFVLSKNCIELLKKSDRGRIIHIASVHAFGGGNGPAYASSKAGIINLTKDMSLSLGQYGSPSSFSSIPEPSIFSSSISLFKVYLFSFIYNGVFDGP